MNKIITILLLLLSLMIISGCGKEDCTLKDSTYEKFSWNDDKGECVAQKIPKDECGNGIAEEGEDFCNCPKDVSKSHPKLGCSGLIGDYLEQACNSNEECVLFQNNKVVEETKTVQLKNSDIILDGIFTYNNPFILNTEDKNKLDVDITFLKTVSTSNKIRNMVVKEIRIEDSSSSLLGSATYNENLAISGDKLSLKQIPLSDTSEYLSQITVKVKIMISYTLDQYDTKGELVKSTDKIETLIGSIGRIKFINPNFEEK